MSVNNTTHSPRVTHYPKVRYYRRRKLKQLPIPPISQKKPFLEWLSSWFWWLFFRLVFSYFIFMLGYIVGSPIGGRGLC